MVGGELDAAEAALAAFAERGDLPEKGAGIATDEADAPCGAVLVGAQATQA